MNPTDNDDFAALLMLNFASPAVSPTHQPQHQNNLNDASLNSNPFSLNHTPLNNKNISSSISRKSGKDQFPSPKNGEETNNNVDDDDDDDGDKDDNKKTNNDNGEPKTDHSIKYLHQYASSAVLNKIKDNQVEQETVSVNTLYRNAIRDRQIASRSSGSPRSAATKSVESARTGSDAAESFKLPENWTSKLLYQPPDFREKRITYISPTGAQFLDVENIKKYLNGEIDVPQSNRLFGTTGIAVVGNYAQSTSRINNNSSFSKKYSPTTTVTPAVRHNNSMLMGLASAAPLLGPPLVNNTTSATSVYPQYPQHGLPSTAPLPPLPGPPVLNNTIHSRGTTPDQISLINGEWTKEEINKLNIAVSVCLGYNNNESNIDWNVVAKFLATRSNSDCLLQYKKMQQANNPVANQVDKEMTDKVKSSNKNTPNNESAVAAAATTRPFVDTLNNYLPPGWKVTRIANGGKLYTHALHGQVRSLIEAQRFSSEKTKHHNALVDRDRKLATDMVDQKNARKSSTSSSSSSSSSSSNSSSSSSSFGTDSNNADSNSFNDSKTSQHKPTHRYKIGDHIDCRFKPGHFEFYPGQIWGINEQKNSYIVKYDDGSIDPNVEDVSTISKKVYKLADSNKTIKGYAFERIRLVKSVNDPSFAGARSSVTNASVSNSSSIKRKRKSTIKRSKQTKSAYKRSKKNIISASSSSSSSPSSPIINLIVCDRCDGEYNINDTSLTLDEANQIDEWICGICLGTHQVAVSVVGGQNHNTNKKGHRMNKNLEHRMNNNMDSIHQCPHCPDDPPFAGASGLWYHMKSHHNASTRSYMKQKRDKQTWSKDEIRKNMEGSRKFRSPGGGISWQAVAKYVGGDRTASACFQKYQKSPKSKQLSPFPSPFPTPSSASSSSRARSPPQQNPVVVIWTEEDNENLSAGMKKYNTHQLNETMYWESVSKFVLSKRATYYKGQYSADQCKEKYKSLVRILKQTKYARGITNANDASLDTWPSPVIDNSKRQQYYYKGQYYYKDTKESVN